jgi:integrase
MRGHVRRRGATWSVVYDEGRDERGRRIQRWRGGYRTRAEAEQALTKILNALGTQTYVPPAKATFREYVTDTWWPHLEETRRPSTVDTYRRMLEKHIYPVVGHIPLQKLSPADVDRVYRDAAKDGLKPNTIRVIGAIVSAALAYAKRKGLVLHNVAENSDPPKAVRPHRTIWTAKETARFLGAVEDDRLYALWRLLVVTGVRRGEACGLTWLNVDLKAGTITVTQQLVPVGGELVFQAPKTAAGFRKVPIDAGTVEALRRHRETQTLERDILGPPAIDRDLVFTKLDGEPLNPRALSQAFQVRRKNAKLPHVRLHDLRHGAATLALEGDVNLELIRRRMGHAHISTTIDLYARHEIESSERAAADTVADLIDSR